MYLSQFFLPTLKDDPKDAQVVSHKLSLRAGLIRQMSSGLYNWLPLGLKVLKRVEKIVREEMNNAGAVEVMMPTVQPIDLWKKSGRFGHAGDLTTEMLTFKDRNDNLLTFSPTAEEVVTELFATNAQSYKDMPLNVYQISWKFRDEIRPRFGLMRAREFLMKDAYSFDIDETSALISYEKMFVAYLKAFKRMGLKSVPVKADTGAMGGDLSHEFHILAENGESTIYFQRGLEEFLASEDVNLDNYRTFYANEKEKYNPAECSIPESELQIRKGIEVGHIFYLGDKYTQSMGVQVQGQDGKLFTPKMGCYGIGVSRLVAAIIEASHDENGIIWPKEVAPFDSIILNLKVGDEKTDSVANDLYDALRAHGKDVLLDDTNAQTGTKFSRAELIGMPWIIAVGPKLAASGMAEVKNRATGEKHELSVEAIIAMFATL